MSSTSFKGEHVSLFGDLPENGTKISLKELVRADLSVISLDDSLGMRKILNIFPSIDTGICAASVRHFNAAASNLTRLCFFT
jgi:thiol peroxidase